MVWRTSELTADGQFTPSWTFGVERLTPKEEDTDVFPLQALLVNGKNEQMLPGGPRNQELTHIKFNISDPKHR